ncbi:MAG: hypothetical protein PVG39_04040 [Desulfobacteraceae bacterium]|jgi:hypothetical protein
MSSELIVLKGVYQDRLINRKGEIIDSGWRSNIIVDRCRFLLAAFMKGDASSGIQSIKIGKGLEVWDSTPPGPPARTTELLTDPGPVDIPISPRQVEYLDAADNMTAGPTHRLRISISLEPGTPSIASGETSYPMREFGLFGLFGTEKYMIDYVRHPVIHKQADDTLERIIHLIF